MGRLSRAFKKLSPILRVVAPLAFPMLSPLIALSAQRSKPRTAPEEVAWPTQQGGYLPPEAMNSFSWGGAASGGLAGARGGMVLGPWGAAAGAAAGAAVGGYEEGDLDFEEEEYDDDEYNDEEY